ncbi:MAG: T9SS type A sorting domain-containing protein [Candidatus Eisenbacteria sp.]|nr:T9SS type A sorting domain-containing protein [Candidatus Eisenbacteria bacterium]
MRVVLFILCICALHVSSSLAEYVTRRSVVSNGAGSTQSGSHQSTVTVGQAAVGLSESDEYSSGSGYWYLDPIFASSTPLDQENLPTEFALGFPVPNPGRDRARLQFAVPYEARVRVLLFDVTGRCVRSIVDGNLPAGYHQEALAAHELPGGVYFCRMQAPGFRTTRRLVLLR